MPQTEARAWWDDVQHLRPDAPAPPPAPLRLAEEPLAPRPTRLPSRRVLLVTDDEPRPARRRPASAASSRADGAPARAPRRAVELLEPLADERDDLQDHRARRRPEARRGAPVAGTSMELTLSTPAAAPAESAGASRAQAWLPARRERTERPVRTQRPERAPFTARMLATPEHFALYAVVLGILLVIIAASSGHS